MKKLITLILLILASLCYAGFGAGWDNYNGTSDNPITAGYISSMYANLIMPITTNIGQVGSTTNAWNSMCADSFFFPSGKYLFTNATYIGVNGNLFMAVSSDQIFGGGNIRTSTGTPDLKIYSSASPFEITVACSTSADTTTKGWKIGGRKIRPIGSGSVILSDTFKTALTFKHIFGNAAANLIDTNLISGVKTDSTFVFTSYIFDASASTYNSLQYWVRPDTVFVARIAATDPDTISFGVIKKK